MISLSEYVATFDPEHEEGIVFRWNGKHASEFKDANYAFRKEVIDYCLANPEESTPEILAALMRADAEWSREAWCAPNHFADLASLFLLRSGASGLPTFASAMNSTFDTFGASHEINLPELHLRALSTECERLLTFTSDERPRVEIEAARELFQKLLAGTAHEGWAKVAPGSPVSNLRVVFPGQFQRLWARIRRLLRSAT